MKYRNQSAQALVQRGAVWVVAAVASLAALAPTPASAANYVVFGQVRQVDPGQAKDTAIATPNLKLHDPLRFTPVAVFDRSTQAKLAESWTGANGQYSLSFSAGSPVDVEVRAFLIVDGGLTPLPPAREGINNATLASLGATTSVGLLVKVASSLITDAGPASSPLPYPGVGIVFTRVGKVEIPYIRQDLADPSPATVGLADLHADLPRANELGLPTDAPGAADGVFEQAPFGDRLLIFGGFGLPGGGAGCAGPIDWYQVTIEQIDESTLPSATPAITSSFVWTDPMSKKRYAIQTFPVVDVITTEAKIGPFSGNSAIGPVAGLYKANEEPPSTTRQVFYSFPDLRVNWVSNSHNGLFRLRMRYFRHVSWAVLNEVPVVEEIPAGCFIGPLPASVSGTAAVGQLVLRVNNQPLVTQINHIRVGNGSSYVALGGGRVPTAAGALDFNNTGLCTIMTFAPGDHVEIDFTAFHEGGYLSYYALSASSNDGSAVPFTSSNFHDHPATLPIWHGKAAGGEPATNLSPFPHDCGYFFDLGAGSRLQNGYGYIQGGSVRRTYYVRP